MSFIEKKSTGDDPSAFTKAQRWSLREATATATATACCLIDESSEAKGEDAGEIQEEEGSFPKEEEKDERKEVSDEEEREAGASVWDWTLTLLSLWASVV
ncbi:UNVERIFIED_CONTAM: hypothetical protein Slati_1742900 [Sesamum latifolium]|uniref:Uncharacterized protein n=1 Tax=Sesamum latifolium TaxID=2727402 RepID=A0AAW2WXD9_9LAMI